MLPSTSQPLNSKADIIRVDAFTRRGETREGVMAPATLPRIRPFLAGDEGEIRFSLTGAQLNDAGGGRKRTVKCIISGWFLLFDPDTLEPVREAISIQSRLVLVSDESALPALEDEADDEDYVALGEQFAVADLIEEEILLDLPLWAIAAEVTVPSKHKVLPQTAKVRGTRHEGKAREGEIKPSAFAKLATLKKRAN